MEEYVKKEVLDNIAIIKLNRPEVYNSINLGLAEQLKNTLVQLSTDNNTTGVIITGSGKVFCAGGDLKWIAQQGKDYSSTFYKIVSKFNEVIIEIRNMKKPVFAAINGIAAGGGFSLALACDFRIMETQAQFILAYTSRGLSIDGGGTYTLPRIVGIAKALEIIAFDKPISSDEALRLGLVTEVVKEGYSVERSVQLIKQITSKVPLHSYWICKKLIYESFYNPLELQLEKERESICWASRQPDGIKGILSFIEKRSS